MKYIHRTFSRYYPSHHPKKGQLTYFPDKIWKWYFDHHKGDVRDLLHYHDLYDQQYGVDAIKNVHNFTGKHHTIRGGNHFNVGDFLVPKIWTGKPYNSKQIQIAPPIEVVKTWDFCIDPLGGEYRMNGFEIPIDKLRLIALNDGFTELDDFELWFNVKRGEGFIGQIICWNPEVEY